jgi:hypothetical protein
MHPENGLLVRGCTILPQTAFEQLILLAAAFFVIQAAMLASVFECSRTGAPCELLAWSLPVKQMQATTLP